MASVGDTITYTFSNGREQEDISNIGKITVDYLDGAGGGTTGAGSGAGSGGRVENTVIDVSGYSTLYIWVAKSDFGRYYGNIVNAFSGEGGGSTEISISNTDSSDSDDEPFLVGAGGGGGEWGEGFYGSTVTGGDAERGTTSTEPPLGGDGAQIGGSAGDGDGAVDDQNRGLVIQSGTTTKGGGSSQDTAGEVRLTFESIAPSAPTNLQITNTTTEDELTLDWDAVSEAAGYYVYRAESSGSTTSDYIQVADVSAPPYTDTGLEDGEQYYYRVSGHT